MPTTRRSAGAARGRTGPTKGQSTISFTNKVTKAVPKDTKSLVTPSNTTKIEVPEKEKPANVHEEEPPVDNKDEEEQPETVVPISEAEIKARKLTDSHINTYWKGIERERKAPRVHQGGLSVSDRVLRYFDVSSQYGPCIGIDRTKRWERAERLGLSPPIEVLAVLLKERERSGGRVERAQMDDILNSIAVG